MRTLGPTSLPDPAIVMQSNAEAFLATVTAQTGRDALDMSGIPYVSSGNLTWNGLQIDLQKVNKDAWPVVKLENQFNDPPGEGKRMLMLTLQVTNVAGIEQEPVKIADINFRIMGEYQIPYTTFDEDTRCGVVPNVLQGELAPGESVTGNVCIQVPSTEDGLLLVYRAQGQYPDVYFSIPE